MMENSVAGFEQCPEGLHMNTTFVKSLFRLWIAITSVVGYVVMYKSSITCWYQNCIIIRVFNLHYINLFIFC